MLQHDPMRRMPGTYDARFVICPSWWDARVVRRSRLRRSRALGSRRVAPRLARRRRTVMGLGIWSMHFIGMLAFHLPVPIAYDVPLVVLSVFVAIAASSSALMVVGRRLTTLVAGGMTMGGAWRHALHRHGLDARRSRSQRD